MGFIGKRKLGFVVRIKGGLVVAWRRVWPCARLWEHAYLAGGIVCSRLSASRSHRKVTVCTPRRRGVPFTRVKGTKTRLGLCPKTPVAGCAGYGLIFDGSQKSIRTAHRIAPKVATGVSALSPHPLSRWRERGSDGRASAGRQSGTRGMLGLAKTASRRP